MSDEKTEAMLALRLIRKDLERAMEKIDRVTAPRPSVIPCYKGGHHCSFPACPQTCDGRPGRTLK